MEARAGRGMNWLAHVWLSAPEPEQRLGNLLSDLLRPPELNRLAPSYRRGVECHHFIDQFTDGHPVVRRSAQRFWRFNRRAAPILVDLFYDHILASGWPDFEPEPLADFTRTFYSEYRTRRLEIPESARPLLDRIANEDWFGAYASLDAIRLTLNRMEARLRFRLPLVGAIDVFEEEASALRGDFEEFLPELRRALAARLTPGSILPLEAGENSSV